MRFSRLLPFLIFTIFPGPATHAESTVEMPFQYSHNLIWIKINAAGQKEPLNFLLDTGAGATVLNIETARQLGLKFGETETILGVNSRGTARWVSGFNALAAGFRVRNYLLALNLDNVSRVCGRRIDGLLGADFLQGHVVQIDYAAGIIRLLTGATAPKTAAVSLPLRRLNDDWCVPVSVCGNKPQWMRVDTGCDEALHWVVSKRDRMQKTGMTSIGLSHASGNFIKADVQLGAEHLPGVTVGIQENGIFAGESGLVGNGLLSKFKVTIDTEANKVLLERN